MSNSMNNLRQGFSDPKSRLSFIFVAVIAAIIFFVGIRIFKKSDAVTTETTSTLQVAKSVESIPGAVDQTEAYTKLQQQENDKQAEIARKKGTSAIPTIIGSSLFSSGKNIQEIDDSKKGVGFSSLARLQNTNEVLRAAWFDKLKETACSEEAVREALRQGASLAQLRQADCRAQQLCYLGLELKQMLDAGYPPETLKKCEFSAKSLKQSGLSLEQLRLAGVSACEQKHLKQDAKSLLEAGYSAGELLGAGFSEELIRDAEGIPKNLDVAIFRKIKCDPLSLKKARSRGISAAQVKEYVGCDAEQLRHPGYTLEELKAAQYRAAQLRKAGFSAAELKAARFSAEDLKAAGFNAATLKAVGFSANALRKAGFTASKLRAAGFSAEALKAANFGIHALRQAGFSAKALASIGVSAKALRQAGFTACDLKKANISLKAQRASGMTAQLLSESGVSEIALKAAGFDDAQIQAIQPNKAALQALLSSGCRVAALKAARAAGITVIVIRRQLDCALTKLKKAGFTADQLRRACYSVKQLRAAGFTAKDLKAAGFSAGELKAAGYHLKALAEAGFSAKALVDADYSTAQLRAAGFSAAQLKASGMSARELKAAGYNLEELTKAGFDAKALIDTGYSATQLRAAGFSAAQLKASGVSARELKAAGFDAKALKAAGFSADVLKAIGFSAEALRKAGFNATELKAAGFDLAALKAAGFSTSKLKAANFSATELKNAGFSVAELKSAGFDAKALRDANVSIAELKAVGFSPTDLKAAGFSAAELKAAGFSAKALKAAGFDLKALKAAGFTAKELRMAGVSARALKAAGFSAKDLLAAGFTPKQLSQLDFSNQNLRRSAEDLLSEVDVGLASISQEQLNHLNALVNGLLEEESGRGDKLEEFMQQQSKQLAAQLKRKDQRESLSNMERFARQLTGKEKTIKQQFVISKPDKVSKTAVDHTEIKAIKKVILDPGFELNDPASVADFDEHYTRAGDISFAILDTAVNTDEPGPITASIVSGIFHGAKLLGTLGPLTAEGQKIALNFNLMTLPRAKASIPITAVAIDPSTARTALSSYTNNHTLLRYGSLFASSFLQGYAQAISERGTTVTANAAGDTTVNSVPLDGREQVLVALGEAGTNWATESKRTFNRRATIHIYSGTNMAILFTQDFVVKLLRYHNVRGLHEHNR